MAQKEYIDWRTFKINEIQNITVNIDKRKYKLPFKVAAYLYGYLCTVAKDKGKITVKEIKMVTETLNLMPYLNADNVDFIEYSKISKVRHFIIRILIKIINILDKENVIFVETYL